MSRSGRRVLPVINLKGGTTKTTTAVFVAHVLHELGMSVLLVDADPQKSAMDWNDDAPEPMPFPIIALPTPQLHKQLNDVAGDRFNAIVIDTPPLEQKSGIVMSALRVATVALAPIAPTPIEYKRLADVQKSVTDAADLRADESPVPLAVLLTRTVPHALSTEGYRHQITEDGMWCLSTSVGRLEQFAQAYGDNITNARGTAYGDAVTEILAREQAA